MIVRLVGLAALLLLGVPTLAAPVETLDIVRADDSHITAYLEHAVAAPPQAVLIVLQGSACMDVGPKGGDRMDLALPARLARLDIEKYALGPANNGNDGKSCPADYMASNSIEQRVGDVLAVVAMLRSTAPAWWNGRVLLMGTSEGATVAAMAGPLMAETRGIVLVNGSIGRPFRDGYADAMVASVAAGGGDAKAQREVREEAAATWVRARATPIVTEEVFGVGNTLRWWKSIIDLRPSNQLLLTNAPILLLQADHDEMTPVASARAMVEQFRKQGRTNLTYIELPGLTHGLRRLDGAPGWQPVLDRITAWLAAQL